MPIKIYLEENIVNLWQREAELEKIVVLAVRYFRGRFFVNGLREAMYPKVFAVNILMC